MTYKALIFDMDGTIVHNMPTHNQAWQDTLAEAGVQIDQDEFHRKTSGQKNAEIVRLMLGEHLSSEEVAQWSERKEVLYRERFAEQRETVPGFMALLHAAREKGLVAAVASAAPPENLDFILDGLDLRKRFEVVVGGEDVERGKPNPDIFLKAAINLGVKPEECLVFEDALAGIEAARRAGMDVIVVLTTLHREEVEQIPHVLQAVEDFSQLNVATLLA